MPYPDLRAFLADIEDDVLHIPGEIDPKFEIAALLRQTQSEGSAILCDNVKGYPDARVIGNLFSSRARTAKALGTDEDHLNETYLSAKTRHAEPIIFDGLAPVKEVVHKNPTDILELLPILTHYEKDAGPYITSGVVFAKDPVSGRRAMGIHRMMVHGGNRLGIFLANPPLSVYLASAEQEGKPLEVAVALGLDAATILAAVVKAGSAGPDKVEIAGGLRGLPLELTPAETIDLLIPARAEVVIEGRVLPGERMPEGPFGENTGYYFSDNSPVFEATAVLHRKDFIYSALCPWTTDVDNLLSLAAGTELLGQLQAQAHGICDLELVTGTCGFTAIISVDSLKVSDVRRTIMLALGMDRRLKSVTVVDNDVDIRSPREVAWAMATRYQPDRDTLILENMEGYVIDPSVQGGSGSNIGFDATLKNRDENPMIATPADADERARQFVLQARSG